MRGEAPILSLRFERDGNLSKFYHKMGGNSFGALSIEIEKKQIEEVMDGTELVNKEPTIIGIDPEGIPIQVTRLKSVVSRKGEMLSLQRTVGNRVVETVRFQLQ